MSPHGRPKGEYRSAQHKGWVITAPAKVFAALCVLQALWLLPASAADAPTVQASPVAALVPDSASAVNPRLLEAFHGRVKSINASGLPLSGYHLAKAQAWIDAAVDMVHLGDRGELTLQSLAQADRLLARVAAADTTLAMETPLVAGATRLREDLWQQAAKMKSMPGLRCGHAALARFEVMLVMAGYLHAHSGWRDAKAYVQASERLARQAQAQIDGCPPEAAPPAAAAPASPSTPAAAAPDRQEVVTVQRRLPTYLYFDLGSQRLTAATRRALDRVAQRLLAQPAMTLALDAQADTRGSDAANRQLSQRRVQAVQAHLRLRGVAAARIRTEACGEIEPRARFDAITEAGADAATDADGQALNRRVRLVWLGDPEQAASTDLRCSPNAAAPR